MTRKFQAPKNAYGAVIQSASTEMPAGAPEPEKEYYRVNVRFPLEYKAYLKEMSWRGRMGVTAYLNALVQKDMEAHPDWRDAPDTSDT